MVPRRLPSEGGQSRLQAVIVVGKHLILIVVVKLNQTLLHIREVNEINFVEVLHGESFWQNFNCQIKINIHTVLSFLLDQKLIKEPRNYIKFVFGNSPRSSLQLMSPDCFISIKYLIKEGQIFLLFVVCEILPDFIYKFLAQH